MRNNECGKSEVKCNVISEVSGVKVGMEEMIMGEMKRRMKE